MSPIKLLIVLSALTIQSQTAVLLQSNVKDDILLQSMSEIELNFYFGENSETFIYEIIGVPNKVFNSTQNEIKWSFKTFEQTLNLKLKKNLNLKKQSFENLNDKDALDYQIDCHYISVDYDATVSLSNCINKEIVTIFKFASKLIN